MKDRDVHNVNHRGGTEGACMSVHHVAAVSWALSCSFNVSFSSVNLEIAVNETVQIIN